MISTRLLPALALLAAPALAAQGARPARCARPDTAAAWHRRQRAWADESKRDWTNDSLRTALLGAAGLDASRPLPPQLGWQLTDDAPAAAGSPAAGSPAAGGDSAALAALRAATRNRQAPWPTRSVVGAFGTRAVWVLAQRDTALLRSALHRMMEAGPDESSPADVAMLEDRLRLLSGRKQLYGTQLRRTPNGLALAPTEDSAHVDLRRDAANLPPLAQTLCAARSATP